jgi:hypothetical protein
MKKEQDRRRLMDYFSTIEDPRVERTRKHELSDILSIAICAIICGADGWTQVEEFAQCKEEWFKSFLSLPNGIPSHDTFGRVFSSLKPDSFEQCFLEWVNALAQKSDGRLIAIDGKTMRRSVDYASEKAAVHMVNAWCDTNKMVIGQIATETKSNEIRAIPKLLELIDLDGAVVTTDAMGCQKEIAKAVIENDGDYILQLKGNQTGLHQNAVMLFDECIDDNVYNIQYTVASETDGGHGRVEERTLRAVSNVGFLNSEKKNWGRLTESAVGAHLINSSKGKGIEVYYWLNRNKEVDFVLESGKTVVAIEVKSGKKEYSLPGMEEFSKEFNVKRQLLVGGQGIRIEEFLSSPIEKWVG